MNINYLNSLEVDKVLNFYDRPIEFTMRDKTNNIFYCIWEDSDKEHYDIFRIKNLTNIYEKDILLKYYHFSGKFNQV